MRKEASNPESNYQDGKWNLTHLKFLTDFMEETGLTIANIAELVGLSRQAVYYWFKKDEVRLSLIYKLFEAYNYNIEFDFIRDRSTEGSLQRSKWRWRDRRCLAENDWNFWQVHSRGTTSPEMMCSRR